MKQPMEVSLIDVRDCPRAKFDAYWQISVRGDVEDGFRWEAKLMSYEPIGYDWQGARHDTWPQGVPQPTYPKGVPVTQAEYLKMSKADQAKVEAAQEDFRRRCAEIYESHPKPVHLLEETMGLVLPSEVEGHAAMSAKALEKELKDRARTASQQWVRGKMKGHRKQRAAPLAGYAIPLPIDPLADLGRDIFDELRYRWRKHVRPLLMAIGYAGTLRNTRLTATRDAIDAGVGAGLLRIYDGTRPATCGTPTTLGAELTYSDPCGSVASQVLTFSAITADASANASITASWYRSVDSAGTCVEDGSVGTSGSDLNLNTTTITLGVQVSVSSKTITGGNP